MSWWTPVVYQGGPRRLADEVDTVWGWWVAEGCPAWDAFGLTVEPHGQFAWCRDPGAGPRWPIRSADRAAA